MRELGATGCADVRPPGRRRAACAENRVAARSTRRSPNVDGGLNPRKSGGDDSKHEVISDSRHCLGIIGGLTAQRQVRRKEPVGRV